MFAIRSVTSMLSVDVTELVLRVYFAYWLVSVSDGVLEDCPGPRGQIIVALASPQRIGSSHL